MKPGDLAKVLKCRQKHFDLFPSPGSLVVVLSEPEMFGFVSRTLVLYHTSSGNASYVWMDVEDLKVVSNV